MDTTTLRIRTGARLLTDVTADICSYVTGRGDGLVNVFVPHATAGLAIMELGAGSERDLADTIDRLLPPRGVYSHQHGSPGHGRDHILPALVAPALTLPVLGGGVALGRWQSIVLIDSNVDNPDRQVLVSFLPG